MLLGFLMKWLWPNLKIKWASRCSWPICACGKLVAGRFRFARTGPDNFCTQACFWTRSAWPQPDKAIQNQISSGPVSQNNIRAVCAKTEPNRIEQTCSGPVVFSGPDPFGHSSVSTLRGHPEPNRIRSGFAQYDSGHLWKNGAESDAGN